MSAALLLYQLFFPLVAVGILIGIVFSGRAKALREGTSEFRQRLGLIGRSTADGLHEGGRRLLWVHAASVGEVIAAAPLLKDICAHPNAPRILLTTTTVAGRDKALSIASADTAILAPMDFYPVVRTFLKRVRPDALILIETELWPMTLKLASESGLALGLANGRMREATHKRYRWVSGLFASLLASFQRAALQNEDGAKRFIDLGMNPDTIKITGNIKFDQRPPSQEAVAAAKKRLASMGWSSESIWIAGSTRRGEEEILLAGHKRAKEKIEDLRLILVPRHPERTRETEKALREAGIRFVRWSEPLCAEKSPDCLLVDELGILGSLYACAGAAFVGATLVDLGGHNILEPALSGVPVFFGPYTDSVTEEAAGLIANGGGRKITDAASISAVLQDWILPGKSRQTALAGAQSTAALFSGATQRTFEHLSPVIFGK